MRLGATGFIRNGLLYDYCFVEAIQSMQEYADEISIVDAGSTDGTADILRRLENKKTKIIYCDKEEWEAQQGTGFAKLRYFSDKAISELTAEWNLYNQMDEIITEKSYPFIRRAVESGKADSYYISRINLWASPFLRLDVQGERNPCSTIIIRLAKSEYPTAGDAESLNCMNPNADYIADIRMYHFGFVRKKEVMRQKIINMQCGVFEMADYDKKLDECEVFDHKLWFSEKDLKPISEPLPKLAQQWALSRP